MRNNEIKLYSFDIFDTLITRTTANPKGIFTLMQNEMLHNSNYSDIPRDFKANFYNIRVDSEYRQRRLKKTVFHEKDEITLDEIYTEIQNTHCLTPEQTNKIKHLEIETELENTLPIPENIERVRSLINCGKRVVLISDMYLPEIVIKELLNKAAPVLKEIPLYLSSSIGYMKTTNALFQYVKEKENIDYSNWVHIGDNRYADYNNPLKLGIKAQIYKYVDLEQYEQNLLCAKYNDATVQLYIGTAKNIRLYNLNKSDNFKIGVSLAAPILYPYINWLLNQAEKRSLEYLLFVARDGYVLKKIADYLIKKRNLKIKTLYIYGSRKVWRLPNLVIKNPLLKSQFVTTLMWNYKNLDKALNLTKGEVEKFLPKKFRNYKHRLKSKKFKELKEFLLTNDTLFEFAAEKNKQSMINALNYLKQILLPIKDKNFAFVDLDGSRCTTNCMSVLIHEFYNKKLLTFYMASTPAVFGAIDIEYIHFLALKKSLVGLALELLTRAPHGKTIGYEHEGEIYKPILAHSSDSILSELHLEEYIDGILAFCSILNQYENKYKNICFTSLNIPYEYIDFMVHRVDRKTANILGSIPHSLNNDGMQEFAPEMDFISSIKYLLTNKFQTENILYSKVRSHKFIRNIISFKQNHPKWRKEIINLDINVKKKKAVLTIFGINISLRTLIFGRNN